MQLLDCIITSPPYADTVGRGKVNIDFSKARTGLKAPTPARVAMGEAYGTTPGQIGALKEGDLMALIDCIITSPPYAEGCARTGGEDKHKERLQGGKRGEVLEEYGSTEGQLGALEEGDLMALLDAIVCSPPYAESNQDYVSGFRYAMSYLQKAHPGSITSGSKCVDAAYGQTEGQIGALREGQSMTSQETREVPVIEWRDCYSDSYRDFIVPIAFSHPAKMARGLLNRILAFGFEQGFWRVNDVLADCFGGICTTGLAAAYMGLRTISVELEPRFYRMAQGWSCPGVTAREWVCFHHRWKQNPLYPHLCPECQNAPPRYERAGQIPRQGPHSFQGNIDLHRYRLEKLGCPLPVMVQGDSRFFSRLVSEACSHRILEDTQQSQETNEPTSETLSNGPGAASSLPVALGIPASGAACAEPEQCQRSQPAETAESPSPASATAATSVLVPDANSPKNIEETSAGRRPADPSRKRRGRNCVAPAPAPHAPRSAKKATTTGREVMTAGAGLTPSTPEERHWSGTTESVGTVAAPSGFTSTTSSEEKRQEESGTIALTTSSPSATPATQNGTGARGYPLLCAACAEARPSVPALIPASASSVLNSAALKQEGSASENGCGESETYWQAVARCYEQAWLALKPGGVLVVVVKDYIRDKKRIPLCDQTAQLLESIGFKLLVRCHAMLTETTTEKGLFGEEVVQKRERKSFFRRLCEKRGSPPIDYEVVLFARKVGGEGSGVLTGVLTSPPYAESNIAALDLVSASGGQGNAYRRTGKSPRAREAMRNEDYAGSSGNLGNLPPGVPPGGDEQ